jgi:Na+-transporting methylmalonyl-CoA/oxaloacetate decarboxylase gamma subunit
VVLALLALVMSYLGRAVLRSEPFADRAVATLRDPAVQDDVADHLTDALVKAGGGDLITVRPVVRTLTRAIIGTPAFAALFRRGVLDAHRVATHQHGGSIFVNVRDAGVLVDGALARFAPGAATRIGAERVTRVLTVHPGGAVLDVVRLAERIYKAAWVAAILAALLAGAAIWRSTDRRDTVRRLGLGLAVGGLVIVAVYVIGGVVVRHNAPAGHGAVAAAVWRAFLDGLRGQALVLATAGAVVAAIASQPRLTEPATWRRLLTGDEVPIRVGLGRSVALVAGGVAILLEPGAALTLGAIAVGLYLVYRGVQATAVWIGRAVAERSKRPRPSRPTVPRVGAAMLVFVVLAAATALIAAGEGSEAPAATPETCNGFTQLCDRPLNDVALAATHNSMASVTIPTWIFGQQDGTIADQLREGVRGLLIDTYYGESTGGRVRTDLASLPKRAAAVEEIGEPAVKAAERLRARIGPAGSGKRGIYLCHTFCELGSVSLDSALADIRSFLVANPGEVVTIVNQDEGVTPSDIETAFERAGLLDLVYRGPLGPFPTLRQMIDSNQRLVVMAENDAGDVPWYHLAYAKGLQETPFRFRNAAALTEESQLANSCRANRGPASAPLFLLNHWVDTSPAPRASLADIVNARSALLGRARTCERIRHHLPNLVAVDFYRRGDLLGVVNTLNGVGQ